MPNAESTPEIHSELDALKLTQAGPLMTVRSYFASVYNSDQILNIG